MLGPEDCDDVPGGIAPITAWLCVTVMPTKAVALHEILQDLSPSVEPGGVHPPGGDDLLACLGVLPCLKCVSAPGGGREGHLRLDTVLAQPDIGGTNGAD
eukprot:14399043-Alexandrium_andersonii.AAC.1